MSAQQVHVVVSEKESGLGQREEISLRIFATQEAAQAWAQAHCANPHIPHCVVEKAVEGGEAETTVTAARRDYPPDESADGLTWYLELKVGKPDKPWFVFTIVEPEAVKPEEWRSFVEDKLPLTFYKSNGDGYIDVEGDLARFVVAAEGGYGDVRSEVRVPHAAVVEALKKVPGLIK